MLQQLLLLDCEQAVLIILVVTELKVSNSTVQVLVVHKIRAVMGLNGVLPKFIQVTQIFVLPKLKF